MYVCECACCEKKLLKCFGLEKETTAGPKCDRVLFSSSSQRRGAQMDLSTDKRGLLWILDEESIFPGATDGSFMERLQIYHGMTVEEDRPETSGVCVCASVCYFALCVFVTDKDLCGRNVLLALKLLLHVSSTSL